AQLGRKAGCSRGELLEHLLGGDAGARVRQLALRIEIEPPDPRSRRGAHGFQLSSRSMNSSAMPARERAARLIVLPRKSSGVSGFGKLWHQVSKSSRPVQC